VCLTTAYCRSNLPRASLTLAGRIAHSDGSKKEKLAAMHIGIDATNWANKRGYGRFTRELVGELIRRNSGIRYSLFFDQVPKLAMPEGVEIVDAGTRRTMREVVVASKSRNPGYFWEMARSVRQVKPDLFFFPSNWSYFPLLSGVPVMMCIHDTIPERFSKTVFPRRINRVMWRIKMLLAMRQATRFMTVSMASARDIAQHFRIPLDQIDLITEGYGREFRPVTDSEELNRVLKKYDLPTDKKLLVYLGGMNRHKNVHTLLKAMSHVIAEEKSSHLVIIGDLTDKGYWTDSNKLQAQVAAAPDLRQHVHFTGFVPDDELVQLLNASVALIFPSLAEGFGLPAVEAMACGIPVLSSDRGSLPEVVGDGGLFFDPEDPASMSSCVLRFIRDEPLQKMLSQNALEQAAKHTWKRAAELAERSFLQCLQRN
jgi:alpha-1,3-rhamnosyl/mannosyltransferase